MFLFFTFEEEIRGDISNNNKNITTIFDSYILIFYIYEEYRIFIYLEHSIGHANQICLRILTENILHPTLSILLYTHPPDTQCVSGG